MNGPSQLHGSDHLLEDVGMSIAVEMDGDVENNIAGEIDENIEMDEDVGRNVVS